MSETIDQTVTRLQTFITENYPQADVAPGSVLNELLLKLAASVQNSLYNDITAVGQQNTFSEVEAATTDTYSSAMDEVASNYGITRIEGTYSTGTIKVNVSESRTYFIPSGTIFLQPLIEANYVTTQDWTVAPVPASGQLQLYQDTSGLYYFLLPLQSQTTGSQYQVSSGSPFQLVSTNNLVGFVQAVAYGSFTSGTSQETDKEMLARLRTGLNTTSLISPAAIQAKLQADIPNFQTVSVIGAGDPELLRATRGMFGFFALGMADVYVRTSLGVENVSITKTGTKIAAGQWQIDLGVDDYPGFYKILTVLPATTTEVGTLSIVSQTYSYAVPITGRVNSVSTATDARFSVYQTCQLVVSYIEAPEVAVGSTASFIVTVSYQPHLQTIQDMFLTDASRIACADYLVKAILPCFVSVNLKVMRNQPTDTIDTAGMAQDIFNYINSIPMGSQLFSSKIVDICHNYNIKQVSLPIQLTGAILANDGTTVSISDTNSLTIPTDVSLGISQNTTMFFVDYYGTNQTASINIEVV